MSSPVPESDTTGLQNLIHNCMGVERGDRVLLVLEQPEFDFYAPALSLLIEGYLKNIGATVSLLRPRLVSDPTDFPDDVSRAMGRSKHTLFLSRLGDYFRFSPLMGNTSVILCYARTPEMLSSPFSTTCFTLMSSLLNKLEAELLQAKTWRITCDLGTDLSGQFCWRSLRGGVDDDFSLTLFPVTTFKPVPCDNANGTVALSRWLMPGAAIKTEPAMVNFNAVVLARIIDGQLFELEGEQQSVQKVGGYLDVVSACLGATRNRIHSWHAGINPYTSFDLDVDTNMEAWCAVTFGSPRYLHFHTCGDLPPGEIAWSIFNPCVWIDDQIYWQDGEFSWLHRADNKALLNRSVAARGLLNKSASIGV